MEWTLNALLLSFALSAGPQDVTCFEDYGAAYDAARIARLPLLVILNPGPASGQPVVPFQELSRDPARRNLFGRYVVARIDTSTASGRVTAELFRPAALPYVAVIDKEQRNQIFRWTQPARDDDWNIVLERYQSGDASMTAVEVKAFRPVGKSQSLCSQDVWCRNFGDAKKKARRLNRPMLLHFYADWCGPCQQMERDTLNSPSLLQILDANFVAVKLNVDNEADLVTQFGVKSLPYDVLVSPDGRVLSESQGVPAPGAHPPCLKVAQRGSEKSAP